MYFVNTNCFSAALVPFVRTVWLAFGFFIILKSVVYYSYFRPEYNTLKYSYFIGKTIFNVSKLDGLILCTFSCTFSSLSTKTMHVFHFASIPTPVVIDLWSLDRSSLCSLTFQLCPWPPARSEGGLRNSIAYYLFCFICCSFLRILKFKYLCLFKLYAILCCCSMIFWHVLVIHISLRYYCKNKLK